MEFQRTGKRYVVAMVDVDHFKSFNDKYGHDVGDQVLKVVAAKLAEVRGGGKAFRYGGEEFTIVFSGKTSREAIPHLDEVRRNIESYPFSVREKTRPKDPEKGMQEGPPRRPATRPRSPSASGSRRQESGERRAPRSSRRPTRRSTGQRTPDGTGSADNFSIYTHTLPPAQPIFPPSHESCFRSVIMNRPCRSPGSTRGKRFPEE